MRAVVVRAFGGPEVLRVESDWPEPEAAPGQVVVRLEAAGVNPVEAYVRTGTYSIVPALPYVPGTDGAGRVSAVGEGVTRLRVGERVYVHALGGTYAEAVAVPEERAWPLPDTVSAAQGAAIAVPYLTAHRAMFRIGQAQAGERLLVHGASGGVGVAAVQMGVALGMEVIATASTAQGRQRALEDGAIAACGHDDLDAILAATAGRGVDLVIENAAHRSLGSVLGVLAPEGRVVVVGSRAPVEINARTLMQREGSIRAVFLHRMTGGDAYIQAHRAIVAGLRSGTLRPVVDRTMPLGDAPAAHELVLGDGKVGKVVLEA